MASSMDTRLPLSINSVEELTKAFNSGVLEFTSEDAKTVALKTAGKRQHELGDAEKIIDGKTFLRVALSPFADSSRGIFATQDLAAFHGLSLEAPIVLDPMRGKEQIVCDGCHQDNNDLYNSSKYKPESDKSAIRSCNGCFAYCYGSKACQRNAWEQYHRLECKVYKSALAPRKKAIVDPDLRLLVRFLCKHKMGNILDEVLQRVVRSPEEIDAAIESNKIHYPNAKLSRESIRKNAKFALKVTRSQLTLEQAITLFSVLFSHPIPIGDIFTPVAEALFAFAGLLNHSCEPNTVVYLASGKVCCRTTMAVKEGEEISVAYEMKSPEPGGTHMQADYVFQCKCPVCTHDPTMDSAVEKKRREVITDMRKKLKKLRSGLTFTRAAMSGKTKELEDKVHDIIRSSFPDGIWPDVPKQMFDIMQSLVIAYTLEDDEAEKYRVRVRTCFGRYCEENKPVERLGALMSFQTDLNEVLAGIQKGHPSARAIPFEEAELVLLYIGSLYAITKLAEALLGPNVPLTRVFTAKRDALKASCMRTWTFTTHQFRFTFMQIQLKLLKWAGIGQEKAVILPQ